MAGCNEADEACPARVGSEWVVGSWALDIDALLVAAGIVFTVGPG